MESNYATIKSNKNTSLENTIKNGALENKESKYSKFKNKLYNAKENLKDIIYYCTKAALIAGMVGCNIALTMIDIGIYKNVLSEKINLENVLDSVLIASLTLSSYSMCYHVIRNSDNE